MSTAVRHVEVILYYRPLCPFCAILRKELREILSERILKLANRISYIEHELSHVALHWNPFARISEEERIHVLDLSGKKPEVLDWRGLEEYAHRHVEVPIIEVRVYSNTRMDKFLFTGFIDPRREDFEERFERFKINLLALLKIFSGR